MSRSSLGLLLAATAILGACSTDGPLAPSGAPPASVTLTASRLGALASFGDSVTLSARVLDAAGNTHAGTQLHWSAHPAGIVEVDGAGVYRAIGNGRVTIVAAVDPGATGVRPDGYWAAPIADSVTVEVRQQAARLILLPVDTLFGTLGATRQLRAQVTDARGNPMAEPAPTLTWQSADSSVVAVDGAGVVRSLGEGNARITVRAAALTGWTSFTVNPRLPHTSCMVFSMRGDSRVACVTFELTLRERGVAR